MIFYTAGIYIFIGALSAFLMGLSNRGKNSIIFFLSFFIICFFSAIRRDVGADYWAYTGNFIGINGGVRGRLEPGYWLLNKILTLFTSDFQSVFIITSIITFALLYYAFKYYAYAPTFTILLLFFMRQYEMLICIIRQGIAIAIFAFALKYIQKKEPMKYFFAIIIAISFHYSAVVLIPMYFILNKKLTTGTLAIYFFSGTFIFGLRFLVGLVSNIITSQYYQELVRLISEPGPVYLDKAIFNIFVCILIIYKYYAIIEKSKYSIIFCNLYFLYTVITLSFLGLNLGYRFILYFEFFSIFLIPILFSVYFKNKYLRIIVISIFLGIIGLRFFQLLPNSMYQILPYKTFLF